MVGIGGWVTVVGVGMVLLLGLCCRKKRLVKPGKKEKKERKGSRMKKDETPLTGKEEPISGSTQYAGRRRVHWKTRGGAKVTGIKADQDKPWPVANERQEECEEARSAVLNTIFEQGGWFIDREVMESNPKMDPSKDLKAWKYIDPVPEGNKEDPARSVMLKSTLASSYGAVPANASARRRLPDLEDLESRRPSLRSALPSSLLLNPVSLFPTVAPTLGSSSQVSCETAQQSTGGKKPNRHLNPSR